MNFNLVTYKTLTGKKEVVEVIRKNETKAVVYKEGKPAFFVDCFDLQTEANVIMNLLVLCQKQSMKAVVKSIGEKNNVAISVEEAPMFSLKRTIETIALDLPPLPEKWLN